MKLIISYIKPERLNAVKQELYKRNIYKMSVSNALGRGQQKGYVSAYRGAISEVNLLRKVRAAIAVNDFGDGILTGNIELLAVVDAGSPVVGACALGLTQGDGNGLEVRIQIHRGLRNLLVDVAIQLAALNVAHGAEAQGLLEVFLVG